MIAGLWLATEPYKCSGVHPLQERDTLCEEGPGAVLQTPDHRPLHLLQPKPLAGGEPGPTEYCERRKPDRVLSSN